MENLEIIDKSCREEVKHYFNDEGTIREYDGHIYIINDKKYFIADQFIIDEIIFEELEFQLEEDLEKVPYKMRSYIDKELWYDDHYMGIQDYLIEVWNWKDPEIVNNNYHVFIITEKEHV